MWERICKWKHENAHVGENIKNVVLKAFELVNCYIASCCSVRHFCLLHFRDEGAILGFLMDGSEVAVVTLDLTSRPVEISFLQTLVSDHFAKFFLVRYKVCIPFLILSSRPFEWPFLCMNARVVSIFNHSIFRLFQAPVVCIYWGWHTSWAANQTKISPTYRNLFLWFFPSSSSSSSSSDYILLSCSPLW